MLFVGAAFPVMLTFIINDEDAVLKLRDCRPRPQEEAFHREFEQLSVAPNCIR